MLFFFFIGHKEKKCDNDAETGPIDANCHGQHCQDVDNCKYSVPSTLSLIPLFMPAICGLNRNNNKGDNELYSVASNLEEKVENVREMNVKTEAMPVGMVVTPDLLPNNSQITENLNQENPYVMYENNSTNMSAGELTILDSVPATTLLQSSFPPDLMQFEGSQFQTEQTSDPPSFYNGQNIDGSWAQSSSALAASSSHNSIKTPLNIPKVPIVNRLMKSKPTCKTGKVTLEQGTNEKTTQASQIVDSGSDKCLFCTEPLATHESIVRHALDHLNSFSDEIFCPICSMVFKNSEINDLLQHAYSHMGSKGVKKSVESESTQQVALAADENFSLVDSGTTVFEDNSLDRLCEKFNQQPTMSDMSHCSNDKSPTLAQSEDTFNIYTSKNIQKVKRKPITKNAVHHTCFTCRKMMGSYKDIIKHQKYHGPSNTCPVCNVEFTQRGSFMRHAASHMRTTLFMCQVCPSVFTRKDNLKRHIDKHGMYNRPTGKTQRLIKKKPWKFTMYYAQAAQRLKKYGSRLETNSDSAGEVTGEVQAQNIDDDMIDFVDMGDESSSSMEESSAVEQGNLSGSPHSSERESHQNSLDKFSESNSGTHNVDCSSGEDEDNVVQKGVVQKRNLFDDLILDIGEDDKQIPDHDSGKMEFPILPLQSITAICEAKISDKTSGISYSCTDCSEAFSKIESLKRHMVISHSEQKQLSYVQINEEFAQDQDHIISSGIQGNLDPKSDGNNPELPIDKNELYNNMRHSVQQATDAGYETVPEMGSKISPCSSSTNDVAPQQIPFNPRKENIVSDDGFLDKSKMELQTLIQPEDIKKEPTTFSDNCDFSYGQYSRIIEATSVGKISTGLRPLNDDISPFSIKQPTEGRAIFRKARKNTQHAQCSYCSVVFTTASEISQHCTVHRDIVLNHFTTCPVCRIELSTRGGLHRHTATHIGLLFSCGFCTAEFSRKDNLKRHVKLNHGADLEIF